MPLFLPSSGPCGVLCYFHLGIYSFRGIREYGGIPLFTTLSDYLECRGGGGGGGVSQAWNVYLNLLFVWVLLLAPCLCIPHLVLWKSHFHHLRRIRIFSTRVTWAAPTQPMLTIQIAQVLIGAFGQPRILPNFYQVGVWWGCGKCKHPRLVGSGYILFCVWRQSAMHTFYIKQCSNGLFILNMWEIVLHNDRLFLPIMLNLFYTTQPLLFVGWLLHYGFLFVSSKWGFYTLIHLLFKNLTLISHELHSWETGINKYSSFHKIFQFYSYIFRCVSFYYFLLN